MSDRAKKFTEFDSIGTANNSIAGGDIFIMVDVSANATKRGTFSTIRKNIVRGPFTNDSTANTGGVELGELYYTADGSVKVRLT